MTLLQKISNTTTEEQLRRVIHNIPTQQNGHPTSLARHLGNVFWYADLKTFNMKKNYAINILSSY